MKDEALRLALEALKTCQIDGDGWSGPHYDFDDEKVGKAIAAIKQALEQPESEPVAVWELQETGWETICDADWLMNLPMGTRLYTSSPKRKQEPVECMCGICKLSKREPLEGVIDVRPIGHHSLQLIFRSQTDIAKFKAAHGIGEKK